MALTPYCQAEEVRSALGVNDLELSDSVLDLPVYLMGLTRELNQLSVSLPAAFYTIDNKDLSTRTSNESALWEATRLFCVYAAARQVGVALASMAVKEVGDGKSNTSRFSDAPYRDTLASVEQWCAMTRETLRKAYATYQVTDVGLTSSTPFTIFGGGKRSYDPVTGV